ncbi:MAG: DUF5681 domain-containing protein [Candidatus Marinimicrobia bacterium]|nr:DUF5681 domain-containing protein [Candidatus Neomarinimicrobiota bacterium]
MKIIKDIMYPQELTDEKQIQSPNTAENSIKKAEHGKHPNSLANLKPYEKGQSGNPGGRPTKYKKLGDALLPLGKKREVKYEWDENQEEYVNFESDDTYREEVLEVIWQRARNGDIKYVELLAQLGCLDAK